MPRKSSKKNKQSKKTMPRAPKRSMPGGGGQADLVKYARLLADPCNAELVHPPYLGGHEGYLMRFETNVTLNGGASTNGKVVLVPSAITNGNFAGTEYVGSFNYSDAVAETASAISAYGTAANAPLQPGYTFLSGQGASYRPVAACMQLLYVGKETDRAGEFSLGSGTAYALESYDSVANLKNAAAIHKRTPDGVAEVRWTPTEADQRWRRVDKYNGSAIDVAQNTDWETQFGSAGAVFGTWTGLTAGTGVKVRCVVVYEWRPAASATYAGGMPSGQTSRVSKFTLNQALSLLERTGNWMYDVSVDSAKAVSSLLAGGRAMRGLIRGTSALALGY